MDVSPRLADAVPEDIAAKLWRADARRRTAEEELKRLVRDAVKIASVRSVAGVLGMSPTTIQKWVHDDR